MQVEDNIFEAIKDLPITQIMELTSINKSFYNLLKEPYIWEYLNKRDFHIDSNSKDDYIMLYEIAKKAKNKGHINTSVQGIFEFAAANGYTDAVRLLLYRGNIDPSNDHNYAIRVASMNGYTDIVRLLLQNPRVDPTDNYNFAIRIARKNNHIGVVDLLLQEPKVIATYNDWF